MKFYKFKKVLFSIVVSLFVMVDFTYASRIYNYFANNVTNSLNPNTFGSSILTLLKWFGYVAAIFVILFTGIQYLTATPQKRAQLKEKLWLIVTAIIILVAGVSLYETFFDLIMEIRRSIPAN